MALNSAKEAVLDGITPIIERAQREQRSCDGSLEQARIGYAVALAALAVIAGDTKPLNDRCWLTIAQVHHELASLLARTGGQAAAVEHFEESRRISEAAEGAHSRIHAQRCADLARCYASLDRLCEAAAMARRSLSAAIELGDEGQHHPSEAFHIMHSVEQRQGHDQAACIAWRHCLELTAKVTDGTAACTCA